jgi:hypothetical protein
VQLVFVVALELRRKLRQHRLHIRAIMSVNVTPPVLFDEGIGHDTRPRRSHRRELRLEADRFGGRDRLVSAVTSAVSRETTRSRKGRSRGSRSASQRPQASHRGSFRRNPADGGVARHDLAVTYVQAKGDTYNLVITARDLEALEGPNRVRAEP